MSLKGDCLMMQPGEVCEVVMTCMRLYDLGISMYVRSPSMHVYLEGDVFEVKTEMVQLGCETAFYEHSNE